MKRTEELLTKEYLAKLGEMTIQLKGRLRTDGYSGTRRSLAKGSSLEFSDFREYQRGDELRLVDWNGFVRFGRLYVKEFLEEKQAAIHIFLDCSRSMDWQEKFPVAKAVAASLAYVGLHGGDGVQLLPFGEHLQERQKLAQKGQFAKGVSFLSALQAEGKTDILQAVRESSRLQKGIAVVISDFMVEKGVEDAVKLLQQKRQEVLLVQVLSKEEAAPKAGGTVRLVDRETGEKRDLELTPQTVAAYEKALRRQKAALAGFCRKRDAAFYSMDEETPLLQAVYEILT